MEVTLNLPENIYQNFTRLAEKKQRRVEEVISDKLQADFSSANVDIEEIVELLVKTNECWLALP